MRTFFTGIALSLVVATTAAAEQYEQTICQTDMLWLHDSRALNYGRCEGKSLLSMNRDGWRLIHIEKLKHQNGDETFAIVFERLKKTPNQQP
ncbi:MAG: hypothetical protein KJO08_11430 [Gammaproteobacteria bacterium]|nr:hypothetical protein [Gammaproteobacteria bacterium]NNJ85402.1 hypothetical protein [Gammaproteobacteria bacterium]